MYQIDDYVVYGNYGLCRVKDISTLDMEGVSKDRQYYFLTPVSGNHGVVYTPVDNVKVVIRGIMTKDNAEALLKKASVKDYAPALVNFKNGMIAVGVCPSDNLKKASEAVKALKAETFCPADVWILVND